ncbi:MAG TPA: DNA-formamidopyrimidine glycosylase family protein [Candidatus Limnocylindria bacterium]|nr:DNA-formamidopyrimidine glycosylase family protein [Candidatus Limnocylindria bacterium]
MPEGDALVKFAAGLRPYLVGREVTAARARQPGPQAERLVGTTVTAIETQGKNLLISFSNGLEVRTHLKLYGSWHRYRPGERWRKPESRARLVLEVPGAVAVCFDAPTVEMFEQRTESLHPALAPLGPDLLSPTFDQAEAIRRLRDPSRAQLTIGEALLDQRALAGIGTIWRAETLWTERVSPFIAVADLDDATLERLIGTARRLLHASVQDGFAGPMGAYRRTGRPCRRCGTVVRSRVYGRDLARRVYWCPTCQGDQA